MVAVRCSALEAGIRSHPLLTSDRCLPSSQQPQIWSWWLQLVVWPGAGPSPRNLYPLRQLSSTGDDAQVRLVFRDSSGFYMSRTSVFLAHSP